MHGMGYIKRRRTEFWLATAQKIVLFWWYPKAKPRDSCWHTQIYLQARVLNFVPMYIGQEKALAPARHCSILFSLQSFLAKSYLA